MMSTRLTVVAPLLLTAVLGGAPYTVHADGYQVHVAISANMAAVWPRMLECWAVSPAPYYLPQQQLYAAELHIGDDGKVSGPVANLMNKTAVACQVSYESWFVSTRGTLVTILDADRCRAVNQDQNMRLAIYLRGGGC